MRLPRGNRKGEAEIHMHWGEFETHMQRWRKILVGVLRDNSPRVSVEIFAVEFWFAFKLSGQTNTGSMHGPVLFFVCLSLSFHFLALVLFRTFHQCSLEEETIGMNSQMNSYLSNVFCCRSWTSCRNSLFSWCFSTQTHFCKNDLVVASVLLVIWLVIHSCFG